MQYCTSTCALRKGKGQYFIFKNTAGTHFMNSESTVRYYNELLKDAFDIRRAAFGLHGRRGLLVADAFTGNFAKKQGHKGAAFVVLLWCTSGVTKDGATS